MKKKQYICFVMQVLFMILTFCVINGTNQWEAEEQLRTLSGYVTAVLAVSFLMLRYMKLDVLSMGGIYVLFYSIFMFGHVILKYLFHYTDKNLWYYGLYFTQQETLEAFRLSIYCFHMLTLGVVAAYQQERDETVVKSSSAEKYTGFLLVLISSPFVILDVMQNISGVFAEGYMAVFKNVKYGIANLDNYIIPFFFIGMLILLMYYRENIKKAKIIYSLVLLYAVANMMSGGRGPSLIQILIVTVMWHKYIRPLKRKNMIIILILSVPATMAVGLLQNIRAYPMSQWMQIARDTLGEFGQNNYYFKVINEMGLAIYPAAAAIKYVPGTISYQFGKTFFMAFFTIIPNLSQTVSGLKQHVDIANNISKLIGIPLGGSIIEEGYVNFGGYAVLFLFAWGFILVKTEKFVKKRKSQIAIPLFFAFMYQVLWAIRNDIAPLIIYSVRYIFLAYFLYWILKKIKKV